MPAHRAGGTWQCLAIPGGPSRPCASLCLALAHSSAHLAKQHAFLTVFPPPTTAVQDAAIVAIALVHRGSVTEAQLRRELRQAQHAHHGLGWTGASIGPPGNQAPAALGDGGERSQSGTAGGSTAGGTNREQGYERLPVLNDADLAAAVRSSLDSAAGPCSAQLPRCGGAGGTVHVTLEVAADCRDGPGALVPSPIALSSGRRLFLPERVVPTSISQAQVGLVGRDGKHTASAVGVSSQAGSSWVATRVRPARPCRRRCSGAAACGACSTACTPKCSWRARRAPPRALCCISTPRVCIEWRAAMLQPQRRGEGTLLQAAAAAPRHTRGLLARTQPPPASSPPCLQTASWPSTCGPRAAPRARCGTTLPPTRQRGGRSCAPPSGSSPPATSWHTTGCAATTRSLPTPWGRL